VKGELGRAGEELLGQRGEVGRGQGMGVASGAEGVEVAARGAAAAGAELGITVGAAGGAGVEPVARADMGVLEGDAPPGDAGAVAADRGAVFELDRDVGSGMQPSESAYRCNFCTHDACEVVYQSLDVVRCRSCGLTSLRIVPGRDEAQQVYEKEYSDGESFHEYYTGLAVVRKADARLRMQWLRRFVTGRELLDVGAGMGYYVEAALELGWRAQGIEISQQAVDLLAGRGLPIVPGAYELFEPEQQYDAITLWALLEHTIDPRGVLEKTYQLLKPGGIAVIETGDISSRSAARYGPRWRMFTIAGHLYFFSSQGLDRVLQEIGFRVVETRLDGWLEHALMQREMQSVVPAANRVLTSEAVRVGCWLKHVANRTAAGFGLGDVMIKVARKSR
jgi:2-polyprenyl-3-methyl-5-hydroxy-6-metoxy-1,4-benzoquinol methylase